MDADNGYGEESADTIWGLTYIDEAVVSRRIGGGSDIGKGEPLYHLYDAQFSVVARMRDEGGVLPRMVERIRYSAYGEPTVFPYSFADCADTSGNDGPDPSAHQRMA